MNRKQIEKERDMYWIKKLYASDAYLLVDFIDENISNEEIIDYENNYENK